MPVPLEADPPSPFKALGASCASLLLILADSDADERAGADDSGKDESGIDADETSAGEASSAAFWIFSVIACNFARKWSTASVANRFATPLNLSWLCHMISKLSSCDIRCFNFAKLPFVSESHVTGSLDNCFTCENRTTWKSLHVYSILKSFFFF